jgi:hypothetical protein
MKRSSLSTLLALCMLALSSLPAAHAADAGVADAAANDTDQQVLYQQALQALSEGRRTDASNTLQRLIEQAPRHAGAWLDLALIQCGLGNAAEAERLFATIETRFAPSRELLELIDQARDAGCQPWVPNSLLTLSLGRGSDRNVNQGASTSVLRLEGSAIELPLQDEFLPRHDTYTAGSIDYLRDLTPNGTTAFAQLQWRHNDRLHAYDTTALTAGMESLFRFNRWAVRATGFATALTLGEHLYQNQAQAQVRVAPPLPLPGNVAFNLMGGVTYSDYRRLTNFDARTFELRPELSYRGSATYASVGFGLLNDHGNAERPGGNRHGQSLTLLARRDLFKDFLGELAYSRQTWQSARAYAPELLIPQVRDQGTQVLRATLTYHFNKENSLQLEARGVRNQENIPIFQYNDRQLQLSWQWQR